MMFDLVMPRVLRLTIPKVRDPRIGYYRLVLEEKSFQGRRIPQIRQPRVCGLASKHVQRFKPMLGR